MARNSRRQGPGLLWRTAKCIVPIRPGTAASPTPLDCPVNSAFCPYPWSLLSACQQPREGHPSTCPSWKAHLLRSLQRPAYAPRRVARASLLLRSMAQDLRPVSPAGWSEAPLASPTPPCALCPPNHCLEGPILAPSPLPSCPALGPVPVHLRPIAPQMVW